MRVGHASNSATESGALTRGRIIAILSCFVGGVPERSKGADCKSAGSAFEGSNPSPSTIGVSGTGVSDRRHACQSSCS